MTKVSGGAGLEDRRQAILEGIAREQYVSVVELSRRLGVSEVSIRHDLEQLEKAGLLRRVHGGAQALASTRQLSVFDARLLQNVEIKRAIGQAAAALIGAGDTVWLDAGTTVLEVARHIPDALLDEAGVTVITRSLVIASELRSRRATRLILLGGVYARDFDDFVGPQVERALAEIHAGTLFLGADGASVDRGLTTDNVLEAQLYHQMARAAERVVVVTDSSKIGVNKLQAVLSFGGIHTLITDSRAPADFVAAVRERHCEVILVPRA